MIITNLNVHHHVVECGRVLTWWRLLTDADALFRVTLSPLRGEEPGLSSTGGLSHHNTITHSPTQPARIPSPTLPISARSYSPTHTRPHPFARISAAGSGKKKKKNPQRTEAEMERGWGGAGQGLGTGERQHETVGNVRVEHS